MQRLLLLALLLLLLLLPSGRRLPRAALARLQQVAAPAARLVGRWLGLARPPRLLMRMHGPQHWAHVAALVYAAGKGAADAAPRAVHVLV